MESGRIGGLRPEDLDLAATLSSGQVFRWTADENGVWAGVLGERRVRIAQGADASLYWEADGPDAPAAVRRFLRLDDLDLPGAAEDWCRADTAFAEAWARQPGVRILRQEPEECFFAFLCASVAPIARIRGMLESVAAEYGQALEPEGGTQWRAFPDARSLSRADETRLRELGLGFRAVRVAQAARALSAEPAGTIAGLRSASYAEAKQALMGFFGVGEKIADCVCLFSLDKDGAVPVDTHIWRIARTRYLSAGEGATLNGASYARVVDAFAQRFGAYAGWAQQTLFYQAAVGSGRRGKAD